MFQLDALRSFVCETLGEPWRDLSQAVGESDINHRKGAFKTGTTWEDAFTAADVARILSVDVQLGHLVYVHRHWRVGGSSRLIGAGKVIDYDHLRTLQQELQVNDNCVWIDCAYRTGDTHRACAKFGWIATLGDDARDFGVSHQVHGRAKAYRLFSKAVTVYIGEGMRGGRTGELQRISFSKFHYQEMLYLYLIRGLGALWEIPDDIHGEYIDQLSATKCVESRDADGAVQREFREDGRHDYGDCEQIQAVAADKAGIFGSEA